VSNIQGFDLPSSYREDTANLRRWRAQSKHNSSRDPSDQ